MSATVITDSTGEQIRHLTYRAFGEEAENIGTGEQPKYTYTGKEADATGLMYYGARYYDPLLARFLTPDTIYDAGPQGLNRYSYALNNPMRYFDPAGYASKEWENWEDELQQNIEQRYDEIHPYDRTQEVKDQIAFEETLKLQNKYRLLYYQTRDYYPALETLDSLYQHDLSANEIENEKVRAFVRGFLVGFGIGIQTAAQDALIQDAATAQKTEHLIELTRARAEAISTKGNSSYLSNKQRGPVLTGVMDSSTGEVFFGLNTGIPDDLHPLLQNRLEEYLQATEGVTPVKAGVPGSHSEINALNQAILARESQTGQPVTEVNLSEFLLHNRTLRGTRRVVGVPPTMSELCSSYRRRHDSRISFEGDIV